MIAIRINHLIKQKVQKANQKINQRKSKQSFIKYLQRWKRSRNNYYSLRPLSILLQYLFLSWSIPMLIVWVFGCPLVALYFLFRNRHQLNNTTIQKYFIVLYQGLKDDRFYWEFVNTFRKVLIVCINVFLSSYSLFYKGVWAIILIQ